MPDKVIDIPNVGQVAFPESMSDADINAAAGKLYREQNPNHPPPDPKHSWIDTAVDWLPTVGGVAGGIVGGIGGTVAGMGVGGPAGAMGGAALGGAAGEAARQIVHELRGGKVPTMGDAAKGMATQAAIQGGAEAVGAGVGAIAKPMSEAVMHSALKPGMKLGMRAAARGETPEVVQTLLKEGVNVTPGGIAKLNRIITASNDEIANAIASVTADVNPYKVTAKLGETAKTFANQVNPVSDLEAVSRVGQEFLESHPTLTVQEAQAVKQGTYKQLAGKYGELKGAEVEAQKSLARGLKEQIEQEVGQTLPGIKGKLGLPGGVNIAKENAREGAALAAREAVSRRVAVASNRDLMGIASLAVTHPTVFLSALADRSPGVKSLIARGLYAEAGKQTRVSPQLIRLAVKTLATSTDE